MSGKAAGGRLLALALCVRAGCSPGHCSLRLCGFAMLLNEDSLTMLLPGKASRLQPQQRGLHAVHTLAINAEIAGQAAGATCAAYRVRLNANWAPTSSAAPVSVLQLPCLLRHAQILGRPGKANTLAHRPGHATDLVQIRLRHPERGLTSLEAQVVQVQNGPDQVGALLQERRVGGSHCKPVQHVWQLSFV